MSSYGRDERCRHYANLLAPSSDINKGADTAPGLSADRLTLQSASPCKNAGYESTNNPPPTRQLYYGQYDIFGGHRVYPGRGLDVGADELQQP